MVEKDPNLARMNGRDDEPSQQSQVWSTARAQCEEPGKYREKHLGGLSFGRALY